MLDVDLKTSIQRYRDILEHAGQLDALLGNGDPEQLRNYTAQLQVLQAEAGLHDRDLLEQMGQNSALWQTHPLFMERMQLLEEIVKMNDLLLPRIHGMMSVTGAELVQLKEGRVAVSGYRQGPPQSKKSIRGVG